MRRPFTLVAGTLLLAGCALGSGPDSVDRAELEDQVAGLYTARDEGADITADCDDDLPAEEGASVDCHLTVGEETADVRVVVTGVGEEDVDFESTPYVPAERVADTVRRSLRKQGYAVESVRCAKDLLGVRGRRTSCTVAPGDVDELAVRVTSVDGLMVGFDFESVR